MSEVVVVLPFVPLTTVISRPEASASSSRGSTTRPMRPPMVEPSPSRSRREADPLARVITAPRRALGRSPCVCTGATVPGGPGFAAPAGRDQLIVRGGRLASRQRSGSVGIRLLLVEDDDTIAEPLVEGLEAEGFAVERVGTGAEALAATGVDLVLLDLGLPDGDGLAICAELRRRGPVPIIVVTARGDESDRVRGLELGADDYVVKPFGFRELIARARAVTRRAEQAGLGRAETETETENARGRRHLDEAGRVPLQVVGARGEVVIDHRARRVLVHGREVALTPTEQALLLLFSEDPGALCTRQAVLEEVWGPHWYGTTKMIDVHVASLRRKLGVPGLVETVRGVGFRLAEPRDALSAAPDPAMS